MNQKSVTFRWGKPAHAIPMRTFSELRRRALRFRRTVPLLFLAFLSLLVSPSGRAQTTATLSGTVQDQTGGVIPGAQVTLTNQDTSDSRVVETNGAGLYAFPSLTPGTYSLKASAKGFEPKQFTGIELHGGDQRTVPAFSLTVGAENTTVTVAAESQMIPAWTTVSAPTCWMRNRSRDPALQGPGHNRAAESSTRRHNHVGRPYANKSGVQRSQRHRATELSRKRHQHQRRGKPRRDFPVGRRSRHPSIRATWRPPSRSSIQEMTQEVTVQASNLPLAPTFRSGPVVVSTISKSGGSQYHGDAFFNARNSVLDANDWQDNNQGVSLQGAQALLLSGRQHWRSGPPHSQEAPVLGRIRTLAPEPRQPERAEIVYSYPGNAGRRLFYRQRRQSETLVPQRLFRQIRLKQRLSLQARWCSDLGGTVPANVSTTATLADLPGSLGPILG